MRMSPQPAQATRTNLAARLRQVRDRQFVGRADELALFRSALSQDPAPFAVLFVHGPGGIGKTTLLQRFAADAEGTDTVAMLLDGRSIDPSPAGVVAAVALALGLPPDADPVPALHAGPRAALLFDTYETRRGLDPWLRDVFLPTLPASTITVIAGREPPDPAWRTAAGWADLVEVVALRNLAPADARGLLETRAVPKHVHDDVLAFAGGHPLALSLVAEMVGRVGADAVARTGPTPDVVQTLLERFVDEVPTAAHRTALEICAHVRVTTAAVLRAVLPDHDADELFAWLRGLSFVEQGPDGLFPHDLAREVLDADLRWRDRERFVELHRQVRPHLVTRVLDLTGEAQVRAWWDLMYLHRYNEHYSRYFTWQVEGQVWPDALRPGDADHIDHMTTQTEGAASAAIARFWLERQPEAFAVYRTTDGGPPAGYAAFLRVTAPATDEVDVDPAVAAAWSYVRRHRPLRPGEHLSLTRFMVHPAAYQRPSPVMDLAQIQSATEWLHPMLGWSFITLHDPGFWDPLMAYIDHHRAAEADVTVAGRTYATFAHDWRAHPLDEWLALTAERELASDFDPAAAAQHRRPSKVVLSQEEFAAATKDALRGWRRRDLLAANPLTRSGVVVDRTAGGDAADTLADLLVEAVDALRDDPRDAKLHRALATTFFHNVPTQEAAAERLGLAFSTYRRHLAAGIDRVADWLWERELGDPATA